MRWSLLCVLAAFFCAGPLARIAPGLEYAYAPYNAGKMDPQKTGWPLTAAERAYVLKPELDLTADFTNPDGSLKKPLFTADNIHLSPEGYSVYAERLKPVVQKLLVKP